MKEGNILSSWRLICLENADLHRKKYKNAFDA